MAWKRGQTIGTGSTATVSLATCSRSGELFAIKSTDFSNSAPLQREQTILSSLNSPHIVSYKGYDITREDSSNKLMYNLMMEFVSGGTLSEAIRGNGGRLDEEAIGVITRQIVQGLDYIHKLGLVHCDIKGQNILISDDQDGVKIADFGCAKWENQGTNEARIGGTPLYMAPEVAQGEEQGCSADIWALGCTIIEMATGSSPWPNAKDPISLLYRIAYSGELPPLPDFLSAKTKDFLSKCLNRDPKQRWTATQLLKHPFLVEVKSSSFVSKQIHHFNSPTSILDQDYWDSMEDSSSSSSSSQISFFEQILKSCIDERIKSLSSSMFTEEPSWRCDENWIMIR